MNFFDIRCIVEPGGGDGIFWRKADGVPNFSGKK